MKFAVNRRSFLKGTLATSALLPLSLKSHAFAGVAKKRAIFFYVPDGVALYHKTMNDCWHPYMQNNLLTMNHMSQPLDAIKDEMVFFKGVNLHPLAELPTHEGGIVKVLGGHTGTSLDSALGRFYEADNMFGCLRLGVASAYQDSATMSFDNGVPQPFVDNPVKAFEQMFGAPASNAEVDQNKAIIDRNIAEVEALKAKLNSVEAAKVDAHLDALQSLRKRLIQSANSGPYGGPVVTGEDYTPFPGWDGYDPKLVHMNHNFELVMRDQIDVAVAAMAADKTQVVSLQCSNPVSEHTLTWVNQGKSASTNYHGYSHYNGGGDYIEHFIALRKWYMEQFATLVTKLKAVQDVDGNSLLDNTLVFLCSELGDGDLHDHKNMPFAIAGGRNLGIQTGRLLELGPTDAQPNRSNAHHVNLLAGIANKVAPGMDTSRWHTSASDIIKL